MGYGVFLSQDCIMSHDVSIPTTWQEGDQSDKKKNKSLFKVPLKSKEMLPNYILVICIFVIFSEIFSLLNL